LQQLFRGGDALRIDLRLLDDRHRQRGLDLGALDAGTGDRHLLKRLYPGRGGVGLGGGFLRGGGQGEGGEQGNGEAVEARNGTHRHQASPRL
jgi:hypothetical protein